MTYVKRGDDVCNVTQEEYTTFLVSYTCETRENNQNKTRYSSYSIDVYEACAIAAKRRKTLFGSSIRMYICGKACNSWLFKSLIHTKIYAFSLVVCVLEYVWHIWHTILFREYSKWVPCLRLEMVKMAMASILIILFIAFVIYPRPCDTQIQFSIFPCDWNRFILHLGISSKCWKINFPSKYSDIQENEENFRFFSLQHHFERFFPIAHR